MTKGLHSHTVPAYPIAQVRTITLLLLLREGGVASFLPTLAEGGAACCLYLLYLQLLREGLPLVLLTLAAAGGVAPFAPALGLDTQTVKMWFCPQHETIPVF